MARNSVTEASLGLAPTEEEMSIPEVIEDDVPVNDDPPQVEAKPVEKPAEKAEEAPKQPEKPAEEQKLVDVRALQEARAEAREAKRQAQVLEQRWNDYLATQAKPKEAEKPAASPPDPNADPLGALKYLQQQQAEADQRRQEQERQTKEQTEAEKAYQTAFERVDADFRTAVTADPTIPQALQALRQSYFNELVAIGHSPHEAVAQVQQYERQHVQNIARTGADVAAYIKGLAGARGWRAEAAAPPAPQPQKQDLAAVAAAQERHKSLSDAPGGEVTAPLDAKALAKMTDKQFKAWLSKKGNDQELEKILGA